MGGIGDAYGALPAGSCSGWSIEWSTLFIDPRWKTAIGFLVLILVLIIRPQGIFGRAEDDLAARVSTCIPPCRSRSTESLTSSRSGLNVGVLAGIYTLLRARPAAQRRLHRDHQLRPGRLHGDRRLHDGDPDRQDGDLVLARLPLSILDAMPSGCLSACRRCACVGLLRDRDDRRGRGRGLFALNSRGLTGGSPGLLRRFRLRRQLDSPLGHDRGLPPDLGWSDSRAAVPAVLVVWPSRSR